MDYGDRNVKHLARTDYRLGFTSLDEETSVDRLPVTGELPELAERARSCA